MAVRAPLLSLGSALLLLVHVPGVEAQAPSAASAIRRARALYYTPVDNGLQSFRCDVSFDWKNFMQKASNQAVPDEDARLKYLQSVRLSVEDTLRGAGELHWNAPAPPPENSADSVEKIREGLQQVWSGFFQSWNGFITGDLVTLDSKAVAEPTPEGYHVSVRTGSSLAEEQFDSALLLQSVHVTTPTLDSTVLPLFQHDNHGLLVTTIDSSYRQPPSAAPTDVHMEIAYAPVSRFQLPSKLTVVVGPATFAFGLESCTVQSQITPR